MDDVIKENECDALRFPCYDPNFNPIRLVWEDMKNSSTRMPVCESGRKAGVL
jgi:transposase